MKEQLYINGEAVDMGDGTISLVYKSNLFSDLSKITSNHSYTIQLPITEKNKRILDNPGRCSYDSSFPRKFHSAHYSRNGVEVLNAAKAILISVTTSTYEIALTWGIGDGIISLASLGLNLRDLPDANYFVNWASSSKLADYVSDPVYSDPAVFAFMKQGLKESDVADIDTRGIFYHPSVPVSFILRLIERAYGIELKYEDPEAIGFVSNLYIPLLTRNDSSMRAKNTVIERTVSKSTNNGNGIPPTAFNFLPAGVTEYGDGNNVYAYIAKVASELTVIVDMNLDVPFFTEALPYLKVLKRDGKNFEQIATIEHASMTTTSDGLKKNYVFQGAYKVGSVGIDDYIYIALNYSPAGFNRSGTISFYHTVSEIPYPWRYPIIPNLPDISQMDFFKAISAMIGCSVINLPSEPNVIRFIPMKKILSNKANAVDWSDKILSMPKEVKFSFSDYAQKNWIRYKTDDSVSGSYDGFLSVNNESADLEKDIIKIPFSPTNGIEIPLYSYNEAGERIYKPCKDRILQGYRTPDGKLGLSFDGLSVSDLIPRFYREHQGIIRNPIVIKVNANLSPYDLKNIDYTIPIYLRQLGKYFAIISITSSKECECELIQL